MIFYLDLLPISNSLTNTSGKVMCRGCTIEDFQTCEEGGVNIVKFVSLDIMLIITKSVNHVHHRVQTAKVHQFTV